MLKASPISSMSSRTNSQRAGVLAVALLAGVSVRLDEIYYRTPLKEWPTTDWIVGGLLAICAAVAVIGAQRILESRAQISELARRTGAIADAAWVVARGGRMGAVLDRVAEEACNVTGADRATVCALDRNDPRTASIVAGHRTEELIGNHFAIDEGMMRDVLFSGEAVAVEDCRDFGVHYDRANGRPGGAAPISWDGEIRGALAVIGKPEAALKDWTAGSAAGASGTSLSPFAAGNHADPSIARSYCVQVAPSCRAFWRRSKLPSFPPRLSIACTIVASRVRGVTGLPFSWVPWCESRMWSKARARRGGKPPMRSIARRTR